MSLALRTRQRKLAAQRASAPAPKSGRKSEGSAKQPDAPRDPAAGEYQLQLASMGADLGALKSLQSVEAKIDLKAHLLPKYDAWCEGVIEAAAAAESRAERLDTDLVLVESLIWAIDVGDLGRALPRIRVAFRHGMDLPQRFERTIGCLVAEEIAETANKAMATDKAHIADIPVLVEIAELTTDHDMPDQARAKLHKAIGTAFERAATAAAERADGPAGKEKAGLEAALQAYRRALALDDKSGVKKSIERTERALKKLADAADKDTGGSPQG